MKIKHLIGAVVFTAAALAMSATAFAATSLEAGDPTVLSSGKVRVPIYYDTTEFSNIAGYSIEVAFDSNQYTFASASNQMKADVEVENEETGELEIKNQAVGLFQTGIQTTSGDKTLQRLGWAYADKVEGYVINEKALLCYAMFTPNSGTDTSSVSKADFGVKINTLTYKNNGTATTMQDTFASYVTYDVPKTVGDDWTYGYIHNLYVTVTDSATGTTLVDKQQLTNYTETNDAYRFIVRLTNKSQKVKNVVDVAFYADTAASDTAETFDNVLLDDSQKNVSVEYLALD